MTSALIVTSTQVAPVEEIQSDDMCVLPSQSLLRGPNDWTVFIMHRDIFHLSREKKYIQTVLLYI